MKTKIHIALAGLLLALSIPVRAAENWPQFKFDSRHSGNAPDPELPATLGLTPPLPPVLTPSAKAISYQ